MLDNCSDIIGLARSDGNISYFYRADFIEDLVSFLSCFGAGTVFENSSISSKKSSLISDEESLSFTSSLPGCIGVMTSMVY